MKELEVPYHTLQTEALMRFLDENYSFRRNIFSGEVEYIDKKNDSGWQPLQKYDQNSITLRALLEEMLNEGFRIPKDGETPQRMSVIQILQSLHRSNSQIKTNRSTAIRLGLILRKAGYAHRRNKAGVCYDVATRDE